MAAGASGGAIRAGKAFVELSAQDAGLKAALDRAKQMIRSFAGAVAAGGAILGAGGAAILNPILHEFHRAVDRITEVRKAADQLGTTTEVFSELGYAVNKFGIDSQGLITASRHMGKFLAEAKDGGSAAKSLEDIGLSADQLINLPLDQQFEAIAEGISHLGTEAERQRATLEIFGRSGGSLAPLMRKGAAGVQELMERARDLGASVSTEDAAKAKQYTAAYGQAKEAIKYFWEAVGASLLEVVGPLKDGSDAFVAVVKAARRFIEENRNVVVGVAAVGAGLSIAAAALITIAGLMAAATFAGGALASVFGVLVSTPVLIAAAVGVLLVVLAAAAADFMDLEAAGKTFGIVWQGLAETLTTTWAGVRDALAAGDLALAWKVAVAGLNVVWQGFTLGLLMGWNEFKDSFVDGWHDILTEIKVIVADLVRSVGDSLRMITSQIPGVVRRNLPAETQELLKVLELGSKVKSEAEIRAQAAADEAARRAGRGADLKDQIDELAKAKRELEDARKEAADAAAKKRKGAPAGPPKLEEAAAGLAALAQGSFLAVNAGQVFGSRLGTLDKIERNTGRAAEALEAMEAEGGGVPVA